AHRQSGRSTRPRSDGAGAAPAMSAASPSRSVWRRRRGRPRAAPAPGIRPFCSRIWLHESTTRSAQEPSKVRAKRGAPHSTPCMNGEREEAGMAIWLVRTVASRWKGSGTSSRSLRFVLPAAAALALAASVGGTTRMAAAALPSGNVAEQWNKIAEETIVASGALQGEGFVYMAYVSMAMDRAVNPGERQGQSPDAAVTEAAYRILVHYFPANEPGLTALHDAALAGIPDGAAKRDGIRYGGLVADKVLPRRAADRPQKPHPPTPPPPTPSPPPPPPPPPPP